MSDRLHPATARHRIRALRCTAFTRSVPHALSLRKQLHDGWEQVLIPAIEEEFDAIAGGDRVIRIPKLELHVKVKTEQELQESLPRLIREELKAQLLSMPFGRSAPSETEASWRESTPHQSRFEELIHYLRTGSLPWHTLASATPGIEIELEQVCREEWPALTTIVAAGSETSQFFFRLLRMLPEQKRLELIDAASTRFPERPRTLLARIIATVLKGEQEHLILHERLVLASTLLAEGAKARIVSTIQDRVKISQNTLTLSDLSFIKEMMSTLPGPAAELVERALVQNRVGSEHPPGASPPAAGRRTEAGVASTKSAIIERDAESHRSSREESAPDRFLLRVDHAGLVLLQPFMTRLFENTGIKETGIDTLKQGAHPRAAALLHFAATGQDAVHEWELGLIKILLGEDPSEPLLVSEGLLRPEDKEEAETLLKSVIHHWSVLKNTPIDGFRSSFLQREGFVRNEETGWKLTIEASPFDILLTRLPWSISVIKLPWMTKTVYVEWQTPS